MCIAIAPNKSFINIPLINIYLISEIKHDNFYQKNISVIVFYLYDVSTKNLINKYKTQVEVK